MSYLLFMDESGQFGESTPYEVRGGIALHARSIWPFVKAVKNLEITCFGAALHQYRTEIKGHRLLDTQRFEWAAQAGLMNDEERRKHCLGFLNKGLEHRPQQRAEFTAYGQACLMMARGIFELLQTHNATIFAGVIPREARRPDTHEAEEFLRKDHVFLLERYFYFLEREQQAGLLVMDETEKTQDRQFVRRLEDYFTQTANGRYRTTWIVPSPFFVSSDMTYPVQAADVCIYAINFGFRLPKMALPYRTEIAGEFGPWLRKLQYKGEGEKDGNVFPMDGIVYVPDPYESRTGRHQ